MQFNYREVTALAGLIHVYKTFFFFADNYFQLEVYQFSYTLLGYDQFSFVQMRQTGLII